MSKFRNRLALVVALPSLPLLMLASLIVGDGRNCLNPLKAWWECFVEGY